MYRLYKQLNKKGGTRSLLILAKDREGFLAKKYPNRYLEGICVGDEGSEYVPGYFSKSWGKNRFEICGDQIELISTNKLFEYNGEIYIKGYTKYKGTKLVSKREVFWKLTKNSSLELVEDWEGEIPKWSKLNKFRVKNK